MVNLRIIEDRPTPREVYNWRIYFSASVAAFAAVMIGYVSTQPAPEYFHSGCTYVDPPLAGRKLGSPRRIDRSSTHRAAILVRIHRYQHLPRLVQR